MQINEGIDGIMTGGIESSSGTWTNTLQASSMQQIPSRPAGGDLLQGSENMTFDMCGVADRKRMGDIAMIVVICDDDRLHSSVVHSLIRRWMEIRSVESVSVTIYDSSEDLLSILNKVIPFDVAFLDIQFPMELSGM